MTKCCSKYTRSDLDSRTLRLDYSLDLDLHQKTEVNQVLHQICSRDGDRF